VVDQDGRAAGAAAGLDVLPAVADHEAGREVDAVPGRCLDEQARLGLPAIAAVAVVVEADQHVVQRQRGPQGRVDRIDHVSLLRPPRHVRLVGDPDEKQTGAFQSLQRAGDVGQHLQLGERGWRTGSAVFHDGAVQDAVAVEERRASRRAAHRTDSHFVGAAFTFGCETSRCQTTAWNASVCGVT
jgi:hypothetical protein